MKKLLTQTLLIPITFAVAATAFSQSPTATRQRRASSEDTKQLATAQPSPTPTEVTADGQTNLGDQTQLWQLPLTPAILNNP